MGVDGVDGEDARTSLSRCVPLPFGAEIRRDARGEHGVRFRLWAPRHQKIGLQLGEDEPLPMRRTADGWHEFVSGEAGPGTLYRFILPDGLRVPDPASRFQPQDVHGPSEVIDPLAYAWDDAGWRGRPWHEAIVYELHVGTFTAPGSFSAAIAKFDHLVSLGVTAIELMPVADFPGRRGWGYDGTLPFAPDSNYGRPEDLKALVDAAHARGLMVFLDVVYNHFGPEGNYLPLYAPQFFNGRHHTPWGAAINYDAEGSETVRQFFCQNALYWLCEYHLDGLRLDAVHAILDDSRPHFLEELARCVRGAGLPRQVHLILENEHNEARWLTRDARGHARAFDAQWNDDVHHVLHVAASGEAEGYYADYPRDDLTHLGRALAEGFAYQGEHMPYRKSARGTPSAHLPPSAFVAFIQNHDQIGNRAFGERLAHLVPPQALRAIAATYLLLPQVPMLFMGEEWAASSPFQFFCDFGAELADKVREGRRAEFARFKAFQDSAARERIPDPLSEASFQDSKLDWREVEEPEHAAWLAWYRRLLEVRTRHIVPLVAQIRRAGTWRALAPGAVQLRWSCEGRETLALTLALNLSGHTVKGFEWSDADPLWQEAQMPGVGALQPWGVRCWLDTR